MNRKPKFKNNPELECFIIENKDKTAVEIQGIIWDELQLSPSLAMIRKLKQELTQND